ncbi:MULTISPECIES: hypothetical protein [Elizabethkingia]|uniref:hypothetical protein n=1 Tax=Elizabethkingia TaxID=308865 RepID=UPI0021A29DD7|nr:MULTISPECIES: hypothetical protein [Elizabethkingia]MCT3689536.1 hypothetical protein [Elizabethkingia anophelis]MCT3706375.1 hypothetical protein [Elizabethkingia anophelis]MCT3713394.1 hypothetical protein [Elizabethkingia anophelis]MCT3716812.1 hypothetical protein [Elizabethkingia anophelis]MCT3730429.1 hypothetical protein [Elizabethkingia anophelis]
MKPGETKTLNKDNVYKGMIWGTKGEEVVIISVSGNAIVYENAKGKRFPCNIKYLE